MHVIGGGLRPQAQVRLQSREERRIDQQEPFLRARAEHPRPAAPETHVRQPHLRRTRRLPSSNRHTITRSRCMRKDETNASTTSASRDSGRTGPGAPTGPRCGASPAPDARARPASMNVARGTDGSRAPDYRSGRQSSPGTRTTLAPLRPAD